jgi:hypothetical protein
MKQTIGIFLLVLISHGAYAFGSPEEPVESKNPEALIQDAPSSPKYKLYLSKNINHIIPLLQNSANTYWELTSRSESADALLLPSWEITGSSSPWEVYPLLPPRYLDFFERSNRLFLPLAFKPQVLYLQGNFQNEEWNEGPANNFSTSTGQSADQSLPYNLNVQPELFFTDFVQRVTDFHPPSAFMMHFAPLSISQWSELQDDENRLRSFLQSVKDFGVKAGYAFFPPPGPVLDRLLARGGRTAFIGGFEVNRGGLDNQELRLIPQTALYEGELYFLQWKSSESRLDADNLTVQESLINWISQAEIQKTLFDQQGILFLDEEYKLWDKTRIPEIWLGTYQDAKEQIVGTPLDLNDFIVYTKLKQTVDELYLGSLTVEEALVRFETSQ